MIPSSTDNDRALSDAVVAGSAGAAVFLLTAGVSIIAVLSFLVTLKRRKKSQKATTKKHTYVNTGGRQELLCEYNILLFQPALHAIYLTPQL